MRLGLPQGRRNVWLHEWPAAWRPDQNFHDFVEKNGTAPDINTRVDVLAIKPTTAVVRVDMERDVIGGDYTDFHTLIKLNGTWHIIAKVYSMYGG